MDDFCFRLREERNRLALTQEELAIFGGVKKNTQSLYERGDRTPDAFYLSGVAAAGIDVQYVLTGIRSGQAQALKPDEEALLYSYRNSSEDGKVALTATSVALAQRKDMEKKGVA